MLSQLGSFYKDNDDDIFAKVFLNESTGYYEVHMYEGSLKEEPPVILCVKYADAVAAATEWTS
jgi:hypothetical protein